MKTTKTVAATAILALMLAGIASVAFAHPQQAIQNGQQNQTSAAATSHAKHPNQKANEEKGEHDENEHGKGPQALVLKVGDTVTLSDLVGRYRQVGNSTIKGNASGSLTLTVTGVFKQGYTLSLSSGTIKLGDQTYTVNGGSVQSGPSGRELVGQGTAGTGVQFLLHLVIRGTAAAPHGMVMLDLKNGTTEYAVLLRATPSS